jgi:ankyrin repeat protein
LLKICALDKKTWNEVCDDNFLKRRLLSKYPGIEKYKKEETWKQFFLRFIYYIAKMKEEYEYKYEGGDFKKQYIMLRLTRGDKGDKGNQLLIEAVRAGELKLAEYAIQKGADIHINEEYALRLSVYNGNLDIAKLLLSKSNERARNVALKTASDVGNLEIVKYLVETLGTNINVLQDSLENAIRGNHFEVVKYLVEHGADIHENDEAALNSASLNGYLDIVKYLVEHGANIHGQEDDALINASARGHLDVVKYLVDHGANLHAQNNGALSWARKNKHRSVVEYLEKV